MRRASSSSDSSLLGKSYRQLDGEHGSYSVSEGYIQRPQYHPPGGQDVHHGSGELLPRGVHEVHKEVSLVQQEVVLDGEEVTSQVTLHKDQVQQLAAGMRVSLLDLFDVLPLVHRVLDVLCRRACHIAAALSHHIEVLPRAEDLVRNVLQEAGDVLLQHRVPPLPVGVVVLLTQLVLEDRAMLSYHELCVRVVDHTAVDPLPEAVEVRLAGGSGEMETQLLGPGLSDVACRDGVKRSQRLPSAARPTTHGDGYTGEDAEGGHARLHVVPQLLQGQLVEQQLVLKLSNDHTVFL